MSEPMRYAEPALVYVAGRLEDPWEEADVLREVYDANEDRHPEQRMLLESVNEVIDARLREELSKAEDPAAVAEALDHAQQAYIHIQDAVDAPETSELLKFETGCNPIQPRDEELLSDRLANRYDFTERAGEYLRLHGIDPERASWSENEAQEQRVLSDVLLLSQSQLLERATSQVSPTAGTSIRGGVEAAVGNYTKGIAPQYLTSLDDEFGDEAPYDMYRSFVERLDTRLSDYEGPERETAASDHELIMATRHRLNWPVPETGDPFEREMQENLQQHLGQRLDDLEKRNDPLTVDERQAVQELGAVTADPRHDWEFYREAAAQPWPEKLYHYSAEPIAWTGLTDAQQEQLDSASQGKPNGLWFSVAGENDWPTTDAALGLNRPLNECHQVQLSETANLLHLDSHDAVEKFVAQYVTTEEAQIGEYPYATNQVDWRQVAADYDGLVITCCPLNAEHREVPALNGWDANSGVVWNDQALSAVKHQSDRASR